MSNRLFRLRWLIGSMVLVMLVLFEFNGSSVGMWNSYVHDASLQHDGIVFGVDRPIRSDEWAVFTPMALSQYYNGFGLVSNIMRGTETDTFMVYGQPVRDWSMIFRPFQIGYLFLSAEKGLSFYWFGKLIILFLVSLEFGLILTSRDRQLALTYAFLVTFAPVVQWWFSTNAFPDMLVFGQAIVLCISGYLEASKYIKRGLYAASLFLLCGAFLLVLYPPWQISFFYVFLVLVLWVIVSHRKETHFVWKKDIPLLGGALLSLLLCMGLIFSRSWDAIQAVMHSIYPGQRMETGGVGIAFLFQYAGNLFLPFKSENVPVNQCEMALFFDCFPLGIVAAMLQKQRSGSRDRLTSCLFALLFFLGTYIILGFPCYISRLLLMSNVQPHRAMVALSYVNLLLLVRSVALLKHKKVGLNRTVAYSCAACLAVLVTYYSFRWIYSDYYTAQMLLICVTVLAVICITTLIRQKAFCVFMIVLSLLIGGTVNPLRTGLEIIENNTLGKAVRYYSEKDSGKWLAVSDHWVLGNFLIAFGAPAINCTNTYMNTEFWRILDPDGTMEEQYNRYAHITIELSDTGQTDISLITPDHVHVVLPVEKLQKTGVEYLVSEKDLSCYGNDRVRFRQVFSSPDVVYTIYHLEAV